jgi:hypothetical protein
VILNVPFIRDQRKKLKAGVWCFQKDLQDWGGEENPPLALKGSQQMSPASLEQKHVFRPRPGWQPHREHALGCSLELWVVNLIIKSSFLLCIKMQTGTCHLSLLICLETPSLPAWFPRLWGSGGECLHLNANLKTEEELKAAV